ncbi:MAG: hypothetical protein ACTSQE_13320 [Candidatus Heimdallarchaeaceae archaeon]
MSSLVEEKKELEERIGKVIGRYKRFLSSIEKKTSSKKHDILWEIRAELELIIVEIKHLFELGEKLYKWQEEFAKERGTSVEEKAIQRLKKFNKTQKTVQKLFNENIEGCYEYLWKLKETISINLKAFPYPKWYWRDGELKKQSEEIFRI